MLVFALILVKRMSLSLVLYASGESLVVDLKKREDYASYIDGYIDEVDITRGYRDPNKTVKRKLKCYANFEGNRLSP